MAASLGAIANGTTFAYSAAGSVYTTVGEVIAITPPTITVTDVDFSHLTSDDTFKEYKAGMRDGGTCSIELNYYDTDIATLYAVLAAGTNYYWKITFSDGGSNWIFRGHLNAMTAGNSPTDDRMTSTLGIKVTAKPAYAVS